MIRGAFGVAVYRLRTTLPQRWTGYLTLVLLVGLLGGLGMGSLAAARRTQSSFSTFLAGTNPSNLLVSVYSGNDGQSGKPNFDLSLQEAIKRLPDVRHVSVGMEVTGAPLTADGTPRLNVVGVAYPVASVNGLFFTQDRMAVTQGRLASLSRPDEITLAPAVAKRFGFHVGQVIPFGFYSGEQQNLPGFGTKAVRPALRANMRLVGLASLNSEIVEDDIDTFPTFIPLTPAFTKELLQHKGEHFAGALTFGIQTFGGTATVPAVERKVAHQVPPGLIISDHLLLPVVDKADRSLKPISIALGVFGGVALLAAILIGGQVMARRLRSDMEDVRVLRALGARPVDTMFDGMLGLEGAIVLGTVVAALIAVALSPLSPLGPVRPLYPDRGFSLDWTVLGFGVLALIVVLNALALALAYAAAPQRHALRPAFRPTAGARVVSALARAGLPAPGVVGVRMALEPGQGRAAVPVRSMLLGSSLAIALVVTTLTFGNSLQTLVSNPQLYGWNWTFILNPVGAGGGNVPQVAFSMLHKDKDVEAYSGVSYNDMEMNGQQVPFMIENVAASVTPPILAGHSVDGAHQVVLGGETMALLHKRIGQSITVSYGAPSNAPVYLPPTRVRIVGTATFPAIGFASTVSDHTSMGTGALLPVQLLPRRFAAAFESGPIPALDGPNLALVRMRPGVPAPRALAGLRRIVAAADRVFSSEPGGSAGNGIVVQGVQRPAEIVNYRSIGITPTLLVSGLALGAVAALALTLVTSVRQRRRDLALLKTVGFVRRQLAAAVAWQASVAAVVGIVIGIPLGIVVGRWLWDLFANQIYAVPYPAVSPSSIALVAMGTLVLANVVAAIPAATAARTPTAVLLRSE